MNERIFNSEEFFEFTIEKTDELKLMDNLNVCINTDKAVVPAQLGLGEDERRLAWVIKSILQN
ncbi:hypothetical protein CG709_06955 [Lachnotalea glycerini]|nr:hypothetical protein CG709_06955 [Lachnotalea glycerini]